MPNLNNVLKNVFQSEISKAFPAASEDIIRESLNYFWDDVQQACLEDSEDSIGVRIRSVTFLWIPKKVVGGPVIPALARAKWERVDPSVNILFIHFEPFEVEKNDNAIRKPDGTDHDFALKERIEKKMRSVTLACCDSESIVEDRIPIHFSKTMCFSRKCQNTYLTMSKSVSSGCTEHFDSQVEKFVIQQDFPERSYLRDDQVFKHLHTFINSIFDCFFMASDSLGLCNWLIANIDKVDIWRKTPSDNVVSGLQGYVLRLQSFGIKLYDSIYFLAVVIATQEIREENIELWTTSWRQTLYQIKCNTHIYHCTRDSEFLSKLIPCLCAMISKPLAIFCPRAGICEESEEVKQQLTVTLQIKDGLQKIADRLIEAFVREDMLAEKRMIQGAMASLHDIISRCRALCQILKFKERYHTYLKFRNSIKGMDTLLDNISDVYRIGMSEKSAPFDVSKNGPQTNDMQEVVVLLHQYEVRAMSTILDHLKSLTSLKRSLFLCPKLLHASTDPSIVDIQRCVVEIVNSRGCAELENIREGYIKQINRIPVIKGMPFFGSILMRLNGFRSVAKDLGEISFAEKYKRTTGSFEDEITASEDACVEKAHPYIARCTRMLQAFVAIRNVNGDIKTNFQKDLWSGLSELYWMKRLCLGTKPGTGPSTALYFQSLLRYHEFHSTHGKLRRYQHFIENNCIFLSPVLMSRLKNIENMAVHSISWSSASFDQFLKILQATDKVFDSLCRVLDQIKSKISGSCDRLVLDNILPMTKQSQWHWSEFAESVNENFCRTLATCVSSCDILVLDGIQSVQNWMESNLTQEEVDSISTEASLQFSGSLKEKASEKLFILSIQLFKDVCDILLDKKSKFNMDFSHYTETKQENADVYAKLPGHLFDGLHRLFDSILDESLQYSNIESFHREKNATFEYLSKYEKEMTSEVSSVAQLIEATESLPGSTLNSSNLISKKSGRNLQIESSINTHEISSEITLNDLKFVIAKAMQEYVDLNKLVDDMLCCQTKDILPNVHTIISTARERLWLLENCFEHIKYFFAISFRDLTPGGDEVGISIDYLRDSIAKLAPRVDKLCEKLHEIENETLTEIQSLEKEASSIEHRLLWLESISSYTIADLNNKFEHEMTLDHYIQMSTEGEEALAALKCFYAPFRIDPGNFKTLRAASSMFQRIGHILCLYGDLKDDIKMLKSKSWSEGKELILKHDKEISTHIEHLEKISQASSCWPIFQEYQSFVFTSKDFLHIISTLYSIHLQDRHWNQLSFLLPGETSSCKSLCLSDLWNQDILRDKTKIDDIISTAIREEQLQTSFDSIRREWMSAQIELSMYKSRGKIFLEQSATTDTMERLEDSIMTLNTMVSNRASYYFRDDIKSFLKDLSNVEESMQIWLSTQAIWSYLEAVFDGGDIAAQMPDEAESFSSIDSQYVINVNKAVHIPCMVELFRDDKVRDQFVMILGELEKCQKSLSAYLETKRKLFPRFYFVSDSTLLEILSNGSDPRKVQKHFQSGIFDGIDHLLFRSGTDNIVTHIVSKEGETVKLNTPFDASGPAEEWLASLVDEMRDTIRFEARKAAKDVQKLHVKEFLFSRPAQISLLGLQIKWTSDVQNALVQVYLGKKSALRNLYSNYESTLSSLVQVTLVPSLSAIERTCLETCITVFIHLKDVIAELIIKRVEDPKSFEWLKHCRFRWREDRQTVTISICDNDFEYGYEYLGVKERLVMTSLTDICYVALTQAVGMNCGGAPAGPAGTGKTETTKDLGATLGKYVVVFNCSDQLDHQMMGRIFKGLAQAGFWGCFDEFNRIDLDVLSVCAQQLERIFTGLKERKKTLIFTDGDNIPLHPDVGYFITMNPGYAGRQELPENLKALFRGVTMMAPDRRMIMRVKLAAAGFQESDTISRKFDCLYTLCEQQLSKQPHYDFGLRNILSVLRSAGAAKRANPQVTEMRLIMKTLYDMNVSKFVSDDVGRFSALLNDVFPSVDEIKTSMNDFNTALKAVCDREGLQYHPDWAEKCVQLYESSIVRHGIMVVGPPRTGKSTAIEAVAQTLTMLGQKTSIWKMNPKSITASQMFGKLDPATGDWTDGIFSVLWKRAVRSTHSIWIVMDGPVDAVWIENLNTVLDDNKVLTLANGDRVRMSSSMRLIFEAENLNNASPATVSRAGVVSMSSRALGWQPIIQSYARKLNLSVKLENYIIQMIKDALNALGACTTTFEIGEAIMAETFIAYLEGCMRLNPIFLEKLGEDIKQGTISKITQSVTAFCVVWGFSGTLSRAWWSIFTKHFKDQLSFSNFLDDSAVIHDYCYDIKNESWITWDSMVPNSHSDPLNPQTGLADFSSITVHTKEEMRCRYLMDLILAAGKIPHLVGPQGCGKSTIARQYCAYRHKVGFQCNSFTFSALTSTQMFQEAFESYLEKRQGRSFGPASGQSMIFEMDNISMPKKNDWGDRETNELMRQIFEQKGFYSLNKPIGEFKNITDVHFVTSSKVDIDFELPNRLLGVLCNIYIDYPDDSEISKLIDGMITAFLHVCPLLERDEDVLRKVGNLVLVICREVSKYIPPSEYKHYSFGIRNVCAIMRSILSKHSMFESTDCKNATFQLCIHECTREIADRLISRSDRDSYFSIIERALRDNCIKIDLNKELYFCTFLNESQDGMPRPYAPVKDFSETRGPIEKLLHRTQDITSSFVLFDDAISHIIRISRVLDMDRKSILLIGIGGSGKKSLSKVSATIACSRFICCSKGSGYTVAKFFDDMRDGFKISGIKGVPVCFMLSDADISDDILLDYVNQQLVTGKVAGIFQKEDIDAIIGDVRPTFRSKQVSLLETEENLLNFFWDRVNKNFHFVLCFSPTGGNLRRRLKNFPGLLSCAIDWFHPWPKEALTSLSKNILYPTIQEWSDISSECVSDVTSRIHSLMSDLFEKYYDDTGRKVHVTPKSYLAFISTVKDIYENKVQMIKDYMQTLCNGLQKMGEAKVQVDRMKDDLQEKHETLSAAKKDITNLIKQIDTSTKEATIERKNVQEIVSKVTKKAEEILNVKMEAECDLEKAKPALESALDALNSISSKDINSLKSLRKPPDVIKRIMDCVLILNHSQISKIVWHEVKENMVIQSSYEESLKMMSDMSFLQKLLTFPKDEINDETVELLQPYFRSVDFNYSSAKKASGNVAGLCNWAESMCKYHIVARDVEPKIIRLNESEKELQVAKGDQESAEQELAKVESDLNILNERLSKAKSEMVSIQKDAENTETKMNNAVKLIESLGGEEIRWKSLFENSRSNLCTLFGDCLLASSFTSYLGPIGVSHRDMYIQKAKLACRECGIETSEEFKSVNFLIDGQQVAEWLKEGLPSDDFSIQNGALLASSNRIPYIIDPQGQCTKWLEGKYPNIASIPISSKRFDDILEDCIVKGIPLLVHNAELDFGTKLDPILERTSESYIRIGDREIEVGDGFYIVLITRLANPEISPENFAKCTVLNFAVTFDGLEEQFLDFLVSREESHLNQKRQGIDEDVRRCENTMKQLEIDLLQRLSSYTGDILEDTHLISVLAETKNTSERVSLQLEEASKTKNIISERCQKYRSCSKTAALLYFSLCDFSSLNHMYNTSLEQFKVWFDDSILNADKDDNISARVQNIIVELRKTVYKRAQFGFFERDKDPFRFLLASRVVQSDDQSGCFAQILGTFLSLGKVPIKMKKKNKDWLSDDQWRNLLHLHQASPNYFKDLLSSISSDESKWKNWVKHEESEILQCPYHGPNFEYMARLSLVRALKPERSKMAIRMFVEDVLGEYFLSSKAADLAEISIKTNFKTPIICIISPGADPTLKIHDLSRKMKIKCLNVSMGQGQEIIARKYLSTAEQRGEWVCIQNAHLAGSYLKELEDHMSAITKADPNFRLWITTEPYDSFPLGLLHMSMRITCEPPSGLQDALVSSISNLDNDVMDEVKMPQWKPLLLSLNIMHVLSQERKRFGPIGWVVPYEFSNKDLSSSLNIVSNHLQNLRGRKSNSINWDSLHYLIGTIQYGGRIIDDRDQRLMLAYCKRFLSDDVLKGFISLLDPLKLPKVANLYKLEVTNESTLEDLFRNIRNLPHHELPQIFGLDSSAEIASEILGANQVFNSINSIMSVNRDGDRLGGRDGIERTIENILSTMKTVRDLESSYDANIIPTGPLGFFFTTENQIIRSITEMISKDLQMVKNVSSESQSGSSEQVTMLLEILASGQVPSQWSIYHQWRMDSITSWLKSFRLCKEYLLYAAQKCHCRCIWIPGISNPKALLNSILQEHIRSTKDLAIKIDSFEIQYQVTKFCDYKAIKDPPRTGVYLFGCLLEGAIWDHQSGKLVPNEGIPKKAFPIIHAFPVMKNMSKKKNRVFHTPLYSSETRSSGSFIDYIPLPSDGDDIYWAQRGTALVCKV